MPRNLLIVLVSGCIVQEVINVHIEYVDESCYNIFITLLFWHFSRFFFSTKLVQVL